MSGFEMRLTDEDGKLVIDTNNAIESASPFVKRRLRPRAVQCTRRGRGVRAPSPFLAGKQIGTRRSGNCVP